MAAPRGTQIYANSVYSKQALERGWRPIDDDDESHVYQ